MRASTMNQSPATHRRPAIHPFTCAALGLALVPLLCVQSQAVETGVTFRIDDGDLQRLYDSAEAKAAANIVQFTPTMKALVEGGGYPNVWIETPPMGGERTWMLAAGKNRFTASLNGRELFSCTRGVRVVTDLDGKVQEIVGIAPRRTGK